MKQQSTVKHENKTPDPPQFKVQTPQQQVIISLASIPKLELSSQEQLPEQPMDTRSTYVVSELKQQDEKPVKTSRAPVTMRDVTPPINKQKSIKPMEQVKVEDNMVLKEHKQDIKQKESVKQLGKKEEIIAKNEIKHQQKEANQKFEESVKQVINPVHEDPEQLSPLPKQTYALPKDEPQPLHQPSPTQPPSTFQLPEDDNIITKHEPKTPVKSTKQPEPKSSEKKQLTQPVYNPPPKLKQPNYNPPKDDKKPIVEKDERYEEDFEGSEADIIDNYDNYDF